MTGPEKLVARISKDWGLPQKKYNDDEMRILFKTGASLWQLYRDENAIKEWWTIPVPHLDWKSPVEALRAGNLEAVEEYADYLSGR